MHFLTHGTKDNVAVAVVDVPAKTKADYRNLETQAVNTIETTMEIPLGHKVALQDFAEGDTIIKYDNDIGRVVAPIKKGEHVHVHNVKTKRW